MVSFASAPGVPNWGGLVERIRKEAKEPVHKCYDVLYVVDAGRSWYDGAQSLPQAPFLVGRHAQRGCSVRFSCKAVSGLWVRQSAYAELP